MKTFWCFEKGAEPVEQPETALSDFSSDDELSVDDLDLEAPPPESAPVSRTETQLKEWLQRRYGSPQNPELALELES